MIFIIFVVLRNCITPIGAGLWQKGGLTPGWETAMKRLLWILLVLPLCSAADVVVPVASVENFVNIRLSPDSGAEIVDRLRQGEWRTLVQSKPGWHEVEIVGGATGYVSADWTEVRAEPPETAPTQSAADDAAAGGDSGTASTETEVVAASEDHEVATAAQAVPDRVAVEIAGQDDGTGGDESGVPATIVEVAVTTGDAASKPDTGSDEPAEETTVVAIASEPADPTSGEAETGSMSADVAAVAAVDDPGRGEEPAGATPDAAMAGIVVPIPGPPGPQGPPGAANVKGTPGYLVRFTAPTAGANSLVYDDGNNIGIGTTEPRQRLEVNGNIEIHEQNSSVAGLMITQSDGETGYIMHNRASTLTIGAGSVDRITIDRDGNVGLGVTRPAHPLELANGAHVTAGGVWTNSSSRSRKENITELSLDDATAALAGLEPVQFNYRNDRTERYVGFIAEDVPELVATRDRDGLSAMDIVAVLTRVVQEQQRRIEMLEARLEQR